MLILMYHNILEYILMKVRHAFAVARSTPCSTQSPPSDYEVGMGSRRRVLCGGGGVLLLLGFRMNCKLSPYITPVSMSSSIFDLIVGY